MAFAQSVQLCLAYTWSHLLAVIVVVAVSCILQGCAQQNTSRRRIFEAYWTPSREDEQRCKQRMGEFFEDGILSYLATDIIPEYPRIFDTLSHEEIRKMSKRMACEVSNELADYSDYGDMTKSFETIKDVCLGDPEQCISTLLTQEHGLESLWNKTALSFWVHHPDQHVVERCYFLFSQDSCATIRSSTDGKTSIDRFIGHAQAYFTMLVNEMIAIRCVRPLVRRCNSHFVPRSTIML
eukprot:TRINITY_DN67795_c0_g1_i1.p1 TRINITY_DN67795_c0_g1~~TRINITY_DN67795_c0_g1_i1.p1  ORF type:complete len:258 (-),score=16.41 TRINITY_DN67795_c0_g1_i1:573-1286(-)